MKKKPIIFSGSSHLSLAMEVCKELDLDLGKMDLGRFPDGETNVHILDDVRGSDVFVIQSIARDPNHYLFEMLIIIDALQRSSAKSITAIIPYLGYSRQDRKNKSGVPITAKLVANLLTAVGITNLITFDLHADQIEGFYEINVDHLHCQQLLYSAYKKWHEGECTVVAPDIGSIKIAERMAKLLEAKLAVLKKERLTSSEIKTSLIGSVSDKNVLIVDDLCSTAGTLVAAANLCRQSGARKITAAVTHGLFVDNALFKIESSALDCFLTTNTIEAQSPLLRPFATVSVAPLIVEAIKRCLALPRRHRV